MMRDAILMYHRVCEEGPDTACYFARGTAVAPPRFVEQLEWLAARSEFVRLRDLLEPSRRARPRCVLTFDDGYRDVIEEILPHCERIGAPLTVFATADTTATPSRALWFDAYYAILHGARRRSGGEVRLPDGTRWSCPALEERRWWVRGELKEHLQAMSPRARSEALAALAEVLASSSSASGLYLSMAEFRALVRHGHEVGGHGATHTRLPLLDDEALERELTASRDLVDEAGGGGSRVFAYPDGRHDPRVEAAVAAAGFDIACGVEPGWPTSATAQAWPRFHVRDVSVRAASWPPWSSGATT